MVVLRIKNAHKRHNVLLCLSIVGFIMYRYMGLNQAPWKFLPHVPFFPGFFLGRIFTYGYPSDTFVKLPGWGKGVVFINGLNLGRHWSICPQQTLYLPGYFLNSGVNQLIVFEEQEADYKIMFEETPDLAMAVDIQ